MEVTAEALNALREAVGSEVGELLVKHGEEGLTERTLRRWLVARKGSVEKAAKDLKAHAQWRAEFVPAGRMPEEAVARPLSQGKAFCPGVDKAGRPILLARTRAHVVDKKGEDTRMLLVYCNDAAIALGNKTEAERGVPWDGKMVGIIDLQGIALSNCDSTALFAIFDLLQNHYVERLHKLYLYNSPTIFYGVWKVVAPFIDPVTKSKVEFVFDKDAAAIFARDFDEGVLPPELGGTGPERPVQDVVKMMSGCTSTNGAAATAADATTPAAAAVQSQPATAVVAA